MTTKWGGIGKLRQSLGKSGRQSLKVRQSLKNGMDARVPTFAWAPWHPYPIEAEVRLPLNRAFLDADNLLDHDIG